MTNKYILKNTAAFVCVYVYLMSVYLSISVCAFNECISVCVCVCV